MRWTLAAGFLSLFLWTSLSAAEPQTIVLWPAKPPGETKELPPEEDLGRPTDKVGDRRILRITNVSTPDLRVFRPDPAKDVGVAVIVCPGGGHHVLAYDHEGTEVAEWLNTLGVTGIVLKYRVPFRNPDKRWEAAVQDAQRAISLVRSHAGEWKIDPQRVGILGFSAGGETAGRAALLHAHRQYERIDAVDDVSCRPDFAALIYPGGLEQKGESWKLKEDVRVDASTPPMFLAHAYDDPVPLSNSVGLLMQLKDAKVPGELHVYAKGGHGYGIRKTGHPCNTWPDRCGEWMESMGLLKAGTGKR